DLLSRGDRVLRLLAAAARAARAAERRGAAAAAAGLVPDHPPHGRPLPSPAARRARQRHLRALAVSSRLGAQKFPRARLRRRERSARGSLLYRRDAAGIAPRHRRAQAPFPRARQLLPRLQARSGIERSERRSPELARDVDRRTPRYKLSEDAL